MKIIVNGKPIEVSEGALIKDIVEKLGLADKNIAAELEGEIIGKYNFGDYKLKEGDRLELIRFVGGG